MTYVVVRRTRAMAGARELERRFPLCRVVRQLEDALIAEGLDDAAIDRLRGDGIFARALDAVEADAWVPASNPPIGDCVNPRSAPIQEV